MIRNQEVAGSSPASSIVPPRRARRRRPARPGSPSSARPVVPRAAPSSEQAPDPVPEHRQEQAEAAEGRGGSRGHHRRGLRRGGPGLSRRGVGAPGRMCPLGGGGRCRRRVPAALQLLLQARRELAEQALRGVLDHAAATEAGQPPRDREVGVDVHAAPTCRSRRACRSTGCRCAADGPAAAARPRSRAPCR